MAEFSENETRFAFVGQERLTADCMRDAGFIYNEEGAPPPSPYDPEFLYPEPDIVAEHGYDWIAERIAAEHNDRQPNQIEVSIPQDPAYQKQIDVCRSSAVSETGWSRFARLRTTLDTALADIETEVDLDERSLAVTADWSKCMAEWGLKVANPDEARALADTADQSTAIAYAVQDYDCRREVRYSETRRQIRAELSQAWVDAHPDLVEELEAAQTDLVTAGKKVLGEE